MNETKIPIYSYLTILVSLTVIGTIFCLRNESFSLLLTLPLLVLVVTSETLRVKLYMHKTKESISISWTMVISLVALLSLGPLEAIVINLFSGIFCSIYPRVVSPMKWIYNISSGILTVIIVWLTTEWLREQFSFNGSTMIFALTKSLLYVFVNYSLIGFLMRIVTKNPFRIVWSNIIIPYAPHNFIFMLTGTIFGVSYRNYGIYSLPMLLFIIGLTLYAFRLAAISAKSQIKELETSHMHAELLTSKVKKDMNSFIETLTAAIDARDSYMYGHSIQVSTYASNIALEMGLSEEEVQKIRIAGLLHDIGKISVPESILFKKGRLTSEEYEIIKQHTIIGEDIVCPVEGLREVADIIGRHHERYDGLGYPYRLKGDEIPLGASIISVADTLDTMLSDRSYKKGKTIDEAIAELKRCSGTQFHPDVVDALLGLYDRKGVALFQNSAALIDSKAIQGLLRIDRTKLVT